jgi:hypothetical protein
LSRFSETHIPPLILAYLYDTVILTNDSLTIDRVAKFLSSSSSSSSSSSPLRLRRREDHLSLDDLMAGGGERNDGTKDFSMTNDVLLTALTGAFQASCGSTPPTRLPDFSPLPSLMHPAEPPTSPTFPSL